MSLKMPTGIEWEYTQDELAGKGVIVTGGTTGIGRATALLLAANGAKVLIFGRHQAELQDALTALKKVGQHVYGLTADTSKKEDIDRVLKEADQQLGQLDILVNNAALSAGEFEKMKYEDYEYVVRTNVVGYIAFAQAAVERMSKAGRGHIVNVGSMSADLREAASPVYVATKGAIQAFSESLRKAVNEKGIKVTLVEPGAVGSDMQGNKSSHDSKIAQEKMLRSEDIAVCICTCLTQPKRCDIVEVQIRPHLQVI